MADETSRRCRVCGWTGVHACVADETNAGAVGRVLRENGLTDKPAEFDGDIHSWRCSHPDQYGPCSCFAELVADVERIVAERVRVAVEQERAARLAPVAGIEALADDWWSTTGRREASDELRALLSPADTAALDAVKVGAGRQALRDAADEVGTTSVRLWLRARADGLGGKEGES